MKSPQSPQAQDRRLSLPLLHGPHRPASGAVWLRSAIFVVRQSMSPRKNHGTVGSERWDPRLTEARSGRRCTTVAKETGGPSSRLGAGGGAEESVQPRLRPPQERTSFKLPARRLGTPLGFFKKPSHSILGTEQAQPPGSCQG